MRLAALMAFLLLAGCQSPYLSMMEKAGIPKREILAHRVEDARDAQIKARYQFNRTLDRYRQVAQLSGPQLQAEYDDLQDAYRASEKAAAAVAPRVRTVEQVGDALFDEWEDELDEYSSPALRSASSAELEQTREQYRLLLAKMKAAQSRVLPALDGLNDHLLFIKHQMNANTVSGLQASYSTVSGTVEPMMIDMQRSIEGADGFIERLQHTGVP